MTHEELQTILTERITCTADKNLSLDERIAESKVTQVIVDAARIWLEQQNTMSQANSQNTSTAAQPIKSASMPTIKPPNISLFDDDDSNSDTINSLFGGVTANNTAAAAASASADTTPVIETSDETISENADSSKTPKSVKQIGHPKLEFADMHKQWLLRNFRLFPSITALTKAYNDCFGIEVSRSYIEKKCKMLGLAVHASFKYSTQEDSWLRRHAGTLPIASLADVFTLRFRHPVTANALSNHCRNLGLNPSCLYPGQSVPTEPTTWTESRGVVVQDCINNIYM